MSAEDCVGESAEHGSWPEKAVTELLRELLENVCDKEWEPQTCCRPVDVCLAVKEHSEQHMLGGYGDREGCWELVQIQCVDQKASGYCGYYCLYFAMLCLRLHYCGSQEEALALLQRTRSHVGFWRRYWISISLLLAHVQANPHSLWWPWTQQHVLLGEMERSYLTYLLTSDPAITSLGGHQKISVVHFAYGRVLNSTDEVLRLQETIHFVRNHRGYHVFILGVTNHWVTLYAYHRAQPRPGGESLSLLYFDSNNVAVLGATDSDICRVVEEKERERVRVKGYGYRSWKKTVITQALCDQRDVVTLLARCLSGQQNFSQSVASGQWKLVLDSFEQHITTAAKSEEELFLPLLLQWLETQHQPKSISDQHVHMLKTLGADCLTPEVQSRLQQWLDYCTRRLADYSGGIPVIDMFLCVLQSLGELFNTQP